MNNQNNQRWYLHEEEWRQGQRPPPVEIPQLPLADIAVGGGPVTPPAFQARENAPPAPRAERRRRPILNPEEDDSDDDAPLPAPRLQQNHENQPAYGELWQTAISLANNALNMAHDGTERRKLLQNAVSALNAAGDRSGMVERVREILLNEYRL